MDRELLKRIDRLAGNDKYGSVELTWWSPNGTTIPKGFWEALILPGTRGSLRARGATVAGAIRNLEREVAKAARRAA